MMSSSGRKPYGGERPQKPLRTLLFFGCIGIALACTISLIVLALRAVPTDKFGFVPHLLILLEVAIFIVASLAITESVPWRSRSLRDWLRPKVLASFISLLISGLCLTAALTPIFNPPAATEETVEEVRRRLEEGGVTRGAASLVERHINGTWGEPGCQVTYEVALDQGLLTVLPLASRDRMPLDWARTQNSLGNALRTLGERESGTARLEEAVQALRAALQEQTRERDPLRWATTQKNLGNALWALGARESGPVRLEEAVQAYRAAQAEFTQTKASEYFAALSWGIAEVEKLIKMRRYSD